MAHITGQAESLFMMANMFGNTSENHRAGPKQMKAIMTLQT